MGSVLGIVVFIGLLGYVYWKYKDSFLSKGVSVIGDTIDTVKKGAEKAVDTLKASVGRGVGTPLQCDKSNEVYRAGLCYDKCPDGYESDGATLCYKLPPDDWPGGKTITHLQHKTKYSSVGTSDTIPKGCKNGVEYAGLCYDLPGKEWEVTSPGFIGKKCSVVLPDYNRDDGVACWKDLSVKGRGAGFPWKFGDGLDLDDATKRCEKAHGKGNCEKHGAIIYPKCSKLFGSDYKASGCCTCQRDLKRVSKDIKSQIGTLPDKCPDGKQLVGRLCYPKCEDGYERRGDNVEYCSTKCPSGFKNIGIGGCERPSKSVGVGKPIHTCNDKEKDAGLCYTKCTDVKEVQELMKKDPKIKSFKGVGPVCWPVY